jgi:predicted peptidase
VIPHRKYLLALIAFACLTLSPIAAQERIANTPQKTLATADRDLLRKSFERSTFPNPGGADLPYRLLRPQSASTSQKFPLIIMLHGSGSIGTDNESQLDSLAVSWAQPELMRRYPAFVLAPQFATRSANYQISETDHLRYSSPGASLLPLFGLIDQLIATQPIDPNRIYLIGFSMGASTSWHSLLLHPEHFAAAILLSGVPPQRILAPAFAQIPLLICHGDADPENPYAPDLAMFKALGPDPKASFRTYLGMAHVRPPDIEDPTSTWWREWLFTQHR